MAKQAFIEIEGHIFDSHLFEKVLDTIRAANADYRIVEVLTGRAPEDPSRARIEITSDNLEETLQAVGAHGARVLSDEEVDPALATETAPRPERPLSWGRKFLMCPPEYFSVAYEINPWMHSEVRVDRDKAFEQWNALVVTLQQAGAEVVSLPPAEGLPDYVFTANAGLVSGDRFIPASFRHPQRQPETPHATKWFAESGFEIMPLPQDRVHEGAGDALPFNDVLVSGYRIRSDAKSHAVVSRLARVQVLAVELVDQRLYHLDLTFCPLDSRRAIVVPEAWDEHGQRVMRALVPEPLVLDIEDALNFVANSVVVDKTIIMPSCPKEIETKLKRWGYEVVVVDVSEFLKAGGACRCLTLALDVTLGRE